MIIRMTTSAIMEELSHSTGLKANIQMNFDVVVVSTFGVSVDGSFRPLDRKGVDIDLHLSGTRTSYSSMSSRSLECEIKTTILRR